MEYWTGQDFVPPTDAVRLVAWDPVEDTFPGGLRVEIRDLRGKTLKTSMPSGDILIDVVLTLVHLRTGLPYACHYVTRIQTDVMGRVAIRERITLVLSGRLPGGGGSAGDSKKTEGTTETESFLARARSVGGLGQVQGGGSAVEKREVRRSAHCGR